MDLVKRLKTVLGGTGTAHSYTYQCLACNDQFVTEESHMAKVACPACGSSDVRSVAAEV